MATETHWCQPWEVADQVPAVWADRWRAMREAEHNAEPKKVDMPGGTQAGGVKRTRIV